MDIASLLNKEHDCDSSNPPDTSPQRRLGTRNALQGRNYSDSPTYHTNPASQRVTPVPSSLPPSTSWLGAPCFENISGKSRQSIITSNLCTIHSRSRTSRATFRPADDAAVIFLSESIRSPRIAIQLVLQRGHTVTDRRRDTLYAYQPKRSCLSCHYVDLNLVKARWQ